VKPRTAAQLFAEALSAGDVNYIFLKRRDEDGNMPPLSRKRVFCIFVMLDKLLGGDGLPNAKPEFWKEDDPADEKLREKYVEQITLDEILDEIVVSAPSIPGERREKQTIIVFSETFFSDDPWDDREIEKVMKCCGLLTEKHKNLVISVNFLHKYQGTSQTPSRRSPIREKFVVARDDKSKMVLLRNRLSDLRFSNCSRIVWNGVPISCYRKTTYQKEGEGKKKEEDFINGGYGYDFGDWKSYPSSELSEASEEHKEFATLFNSGKKQVVASRTCSDMNFTPKLTESIKLLILTADDAPRLEFWIPQVRNANVCCCDASSYTCTVTLPINRKRPAERVNVSPFFGNVLHCVVAAYFGGSENESIDVGCCGCS
jgi:hypothetical protein